MISEPRNPPEQKRCKNTHTYIYIYIYEPSSPGSAMKHAYLSQEPTETTRKHTFLSRVLGNTIKHKYLSQAARRTCVSEPGPSGTQWAAAPRSNAKHASLSQGPSETLMRRAHLSRGCSKSLSEKVGLLSKNLFEDLVLTTTQLSTPSLWTYITLCMSCTGPH